MQYQQLIQHIFHKQSYLCVGLDTDLQKLPPHLLHDENPILTFNKKIIDATRSVCVAYKINTAFYEIHGSAGWETMRATIAYIGNEHLIIVDAKRGDIGNTSTMYAKAIFENLQADAITVSPYMGKDSVQPFLAFADKWTILLALTSNIGSEDFQQQPLANGDTLFKQVIKTSLTWGSHEQIMYVVGATHPQALKTIRELVPHHFLLIPGVGVQGGDVAAVSAAAWTANVGLLINSSRQIIYADNGKKFDAAAARQATILQQQMKNFINR
ncbi:MAG: orotidine-5'-phosphate decarboxylase [Saprospiraceae bacterium]|nr:orotidine-5'-phosphate decarboxylase [Saprospiraceae bacterium]MBP7680038.1 orotidine-5'-phosphate decarboxylase [Saprospiraceae bacterium]